MNTTVDTTNTTTMKIHQLAREIRTPSGTGQASTMMITNAIFLLELVPLGLRWGRLSPPSVRMTLLPSYSCKTARVKELPDFKESNMTFFSIIVT